MAAPANDPTRELSVSVGGVSAEDAHNLVQQAMDYITTDSGTDDENQALGDAFVAAVNAADSNMVIKHTLLLFVATASRVGMTVEQAQALVVAALMLQESHTAEEAALSAVQTGN